MVFKLSSLWHFLARPCAKYNVRFCYPFYVGDKEEKGEKKTTLSNQDKTKLIAMRNFLSHLAPVEHKRCMARID